jgi:hypothetical protein
MTARKHIISITDYSCINHRMQIITNDCIQGTVQHHFLEENGTFKGHSHEEQLTERFLAQEGGG